MHVPDVLDNVERVDSLRRDDFYARYVSKHIPVIIRNTQRGQPVSGLLTEERVIEHFGGITIQAQQNYTSPLSRAAADVRRNRLSQKVRNQILHNLELIGIVSRLDDKVSEEQT